jgi:hypothetical protein
MNKHVDLLLGALEEAREWGLEAEFVFHIMAAAIGCSVSDLDDEQVKHIIEEAKQKYDL